MSSPLTVGVNLLWLVPGVVGGSEEYTVRLLRALLDHHGDELDLTLFVNRGFARSYGGFDDRVRIEVAPIRGSNKLARVVAESTWLTARTREGFDVVHHAGGTVPVVHPGRSVLTILDLQPLVHRGTFGLAKRLYLGARLGPSVRAAAAIVTLSEHARRSIVDVLGAPPAAIAVVPPVFDPPDPPATRAAQRALQRAVPDEPFFLYPAITYPHKNHLTLVRAFAEIARDRPDAVLVLTGGPGAMERLVADEIERLGVAGRVRRLGRVDRAELDELYRRAVALTFPSRFEGFGIPLLEAMQFGCPVIAADATALPEVVGGAGLLVGPDDVGGWATAMRRLLSDHAERARLVAAGHQQASRFGAASSAASLLAAYGSALARR